MIGLLASLYAGGFVLGVAIGWVARGWKRARR